MNRENREQYQVVIQAKDMGGQMGGLSGTTMVNITLTDFLKSNSRVDSRRYLEIHFQCFLKPLDYENRRLYTLKIEAENLYVDPRFYYLGPFKDTTTVKISVEDVDEPPIFSRSSSFEIHEDIEVGTIIGTVMRDPDSAAGPIRKSWIGA
ncbi:hypothetical protein E2320_011023 [Naja naja]|nr:hypothetical protein E2320_011023 [Naja naja]